jgi:hypothetical protein
MSAPAMHPCPRCGREVPVGDRRCWNCHLPSGLNPLPRPPVCETCQGTQFKLVRDTGRWGLWGAVGPLWAGVRWFASFFMRPGMVECITCGRRYDRG